MLTHIYGIQKDGNDNTVCETAKETQMYRTDFLDSVGEGESGMIWENGTEMYTIMEETNRQSMFDTRYRMLGAGARG